MKEALKNIGIVLLGIALIIVAVVLLTITSFPALVWLLCSAISRNKDKQARDILQNIGQFFYNIAASFDQTGNVAYGGFFGWLFLNENSRYSFGNFDDTISFVLGYNQADGSLSQSGKIAVKILNWLDKNHCLKALEDGALQAKIKLKMCEKL